MTQYMRLGDIKFNGFKQLESKSAINDLQTTRSYLNQLVSGLISKSIEYCAKRDAEFSRYSKTDENLETKKRPQHSRNKTEGSLYLNVLKKNSLEALCDEILEKSNQDESFNSEDLYGRLESSKAELIVDKGIKLVAGYKISDFIGEGQTAKVKLLQKGREKFASKIFAQGVLNQTYMVETSEGDSVYTEPYEDFKREVALMKLLNHPNLIKLKEVIFDRIKKKYYMIMEFCSKGAIMEYDEEKDCYVFPWKDDQEPLADWQLEKIINQASQGLYYLHYNGIAHRDIKPENLLLCDDFTLKYSDFGQSHLLKDFRMSSFILGTEYFSAPESITAEGQIDLKAADIWALGVTFYLITFQELPFKTDDQLISRILNFSLSFPESRNVSQDLKDLLTAMLEVDPEKRITAEELVKLAYVSRAGKIEAFTNPPICPTPSEIEAAVQPMKKAMYSKL